MDDDASKENPPADFNKIDLSQLQGFSFGTQWSRDKSAPDAEGERAGRSGRDDRRGDGNSSGKRDRRAFHRPSDNTGAGGDPAQHAQGEGPPRGQTGERRPRRDGGPGRGSEGFRRPPPREAPPYDSPFFSVTFYPEEQSFNALVKTIRASCRTIELFEIARTVLAKPERFTAVLARRAASADETESQAPAAPLYISVPDGIPFETEAAAIAHVLDRHLGRFFDQAEVEVEPPKGNFQVVNRCGITGELLGPPNYHRYSQIVQQHYAAKIRNMPLEAYRARIETVRDPEAIQKWLEKMKRVIRYTWKIHAPAQAEPATSASADASAPAAAPTFDSLDDARQHLLTQGRDAIVRVSATARFHGRELADFPQGEVRRSVEGALERQSRFPLDTANALRGRLRRERFTIFKKGSKGVSYVCAVKRKFRLPGQVLAQSIDSLIAHIEAHPMIKAGELPHRYLGLAARSEPGAAADPAAALQQVLTVEERERLSRLHADLVWLVREGYVTEFIDGSLYAAPPMAEARKKEVEAEEHDPESFPDRPAEAVAIETVPAEAETAALTEQPASSTADSTPTESPA